MIPLDSAPDEVLSGIDYVLTDIDDTMTRDGKVSSSAYSALWRLSDAGLHVIPVTGRPAGWCDLIARQWPVDAVIGENGALVFTVVDGHMKHIFHPSVNRSEASKKLSDIAEVVYREVPGTRPAMDQFSRMFDVAVDFREEPPYLDYEQAERIKAIFEEHGATAKVSSIHVNAWFGTYDKLAMTQIYFRDYLSIDLTDPHQNRRVVFCGDSPNDEPMFSFFESTAGVANIRPFLVTMRHLPRFVTSASHGDGFAEVAERIIAARQGRAKAKAT